MALTWMLSELRTKFRELTGQISTGQMTDAACNNLINDYYQNHFPNDAEIEDFEGEFTQAASASDSGEYSISSDVSLLDGPAFVNGSPVDIYQDPKRFWSDYTKVDTGSAFCITSATLAIGSTSTAAVANSAFSYRVGNYSYSKAAAETALSGDSVPKSKYGAWRLEIDTDGTIAIVEASDNATGYATPGKALEGLIQENDAKAAMGYVIVIYTGGAFVPGVTELDADGVTATYTNGFNSTRNQPAAALLDKGTLHLRPKANDIYLFQCKQKGKPASLSADASLPADPAWGPAIAYGAAIERLRSDKDGEGADALVPVWRYYLSGITDKAVLQMSRGRETERAF